ATRKSWRALQQHGAAPDPGLPSNDSAVRCASCRYWSARRRGIPGRCERQLFSLVISGKYPDYVDWHILFCNAEYKFAYRIDLAHGINHKLVALPENLK